MALPKKAEEISGEVFVDAGSRVRIVVCGEVSSGKTSVVNALLRESVLPDFFGSEDRPVMRIVTNAGSDSIVVIDRDGNSQIIDDLAGLELSPEIAEVRIERVDAGPLGACEVVEMPPMRDGYVTEEEIAQVGQCDILVWTTIGSQAWRLSEKTILDELGDQRPKEAVLAVSRADKFRSDEHRQKLMDRMERETTEYFGARVLMGAAPKAIDASGDDESKWSETGGQALASALSEAAVRVAAEKPAEVVENPADPVVTDTSSVVMLKPEKAAEPEAPVLEAVEEEAVPSETPEVQSPDDQIAAFIQTLHGLIAVGSYQLDNHQEAKAYFGIEDAVKDFASYTQMSAKTLLEIAGFGGTDPNPESEQIAMRDRLVIYQVKDNHVFFLACEQSKMSAGIARTAFHRLCHLNQANREDRLAA